MAAGARRRAATLTGLVAGLKNLRVHMARMLEPAATALRGAACPILIQVGDGMTPGVPAREAWSKVRDREARRGGKLDALTREDFNALDGLFDQLGETGREQQAILIGDAIRALQENLSTAGARARECERLYGTLGLLTGLMLALIAL